MQKNATFCILLRSFANERNVLAFFYVLLQKNQTFSAFFYVLCKRALHSFTFFRKERKKTNGSFGSHKSPKTQKKNVKERCVL